MWTFIFGAAFGAASVVMTLVFERVIADRKRAEECEAWRNAGEHVL